MVLFMGITFSSCFAGVVKADVLSVDLVDGTYSVSDEDELYEKLETDGFDLSKEIKESVDLSNTVYMPEIALQVGGSCVAFATTYYQYSYEVNRLRGITSKEETKNYSPYYIYSYINGGTSGSNIYGAYNRLQEVGCVEWEEFDNSNQYTMQYGYGKDLEAMRNALGVRVEHFYKY